MNTESSKYRGCSYREERPRDKARGLIIELRPYVFVATYLGLSGCALEGAPSYSLFGAFFPASLLCAVIGVFSSLILRSIFIAVGLEDVMPVKLLVYLSAAAAIALWLWLTLFGDRW